MLEGFFSTDGRNYFVNCISIFAVTSLNCLLTTDLQDTIKLITNDGYSNSFCAIYYCKKIVDKYASQMIKCS